MREIAEQWLDWKQLQPLVSQYASLINSEVAADTRKLSTYEAFRAGLGFNASTRSQGAGERGMLDLKSFVAQRRAYLLAHAEIQKLPR
jgi:hypothetical protein